MKILEPNPPPTSGEINRTFCSGTPRINAATSSFITCGACEVAHMVYSSVAGS
jgi:hypothetical protein